MQTNLAFTRKWGKYFDNHDIKVPQNAYDETRVPDDIFPTLLKYMESIKGGMRNLALDIANKKLEEKVEEEEPEPKDTGEQVCCQIS